MIALLLLTPLGWAVLVTAGAVLLLLEDPMSHLTPTVQTMMDGIDRDKGYDRLPVLADALEDGGCTDEPLLAALRANDPALCHPWYRRAVEGTATVGQVREAVAWLSGHAKHFYTSADAYYDSYEYVDDPDAEFGARRVDRPDSPGQRDLAWLLEVCRTWVEDGDTTFLNYDTPDEASMHAAEMWKHYDVLTGCGPQTEEWESYQTGRMETYPVTPFRCAC